MRVAGGESPRVVEAVTEASEVDTGSEQHRGKSVLNIVVRCITRLSQSKIRLIGDQNERIACALQPPQGRDHALNQMKIMRCERGLHLPRRRVQDHRIQHAVAVEENRGPDHGADSHFISFARRRGWDTRRCQTTA